MKMSGGTNEVGAPENRIVVRKELVLTPRAQNLIPGIWTRAHRSSPVYCAAHPRQSPKRAIMNSQAGLPNMPLETTAGKEPFRSEAGVNPPRVSSRAFGGARATTSLT